VPCRRGGVAQGQALGISAKQGELHQREVSDVLRAAKWASDKLPQIPAGPYGAPLRISTPSLGSPSDAGKMLLIKPWKVVQ
jgi:hypothetical protein